MIKKHFRADFGFALINCITILVFFLYFVFAFFQSAPISIQFRRLLLTVFAIAACLFGVICAALNIVRIVHAKRNNKQAYIIRYILLLLFDFIAAIFMLQYLITVCLIEF